MSRSPARRDGRGGLPSSPRRSPGSRSPWRDCGAADPPAALTVFAAALVIAAIAVALAGSAAVDDLARRAQGRGTGRVRFRSRRGAARLPRLSRRRRLRPAADQPGLDRPRLAPAVHAVDQGANGPRRGRAAGAERRDHRRPAGGLSGYRDREGRDGSDRGLPAGARRGERPRLARSSTPSRRTSPATAPP